ncbi:MAG: hypothetical protein AAF654_08800 [Myxococcota bacterium]
MTVSVQSADGAYIPYDTFLKDYDEVDGRPVACGAYRHEVDGNITGTVRACAEVRADGSAVLPGYYDMVPFRARNSTYQTMLAPVPRSRVPATAFVTIQEPEPEFVARFAAAEEELAPDYLHHRIESLERALTAMRAWRGPAADRMLERGVFDNFFRSYGIRRDPAWRSVDEARAVLAELLEEQRRLELDARDQRFREMMVWMDRA